MAISMSRTPAKTYRHDRVDILVSRIGVVFQQCGGLHNLSRLAITALRSLQLDPGSLQRMFPFWVEPFDSRHVSSGDRADRGDTGSSGAPFHMHGAGPTHANPAAEFGPC
jgi:hypothetical protein